MYWLTLTHCYNGELMLVNMALVQSVYREKGRPTPYTALSFGGEDAACVKETPQQILEMIPPRA